MGICKPMGRGVQQRLMEEGWAVVEDVLDLAELQAYLDRALFSSMVASWLDGNYEPRVAPLLCGTRVRGDGADALTSTDLLSAAATILSNLSAAAAPPGDHSGGSTAAAAAAAGDAAAGDAPAATAAATAALTCARPRAGMNSTGACHAVSRGARWVNGEEVGESCECKRAQ